jgi:hypothetical protein
MTNNKQQTAVEWLFGQIPGACKSSKGAHDALEQAKEMEKGQHATTWDTAMDNLDARGGNIVRAYVDFDDYYNETYGGGEQ